MKFNRLSFYLVKLEDTQSRIAMTNILAKLLEELKIRETRSAVNIMLGILGPAFCAPVLNIAERMNLEAISQAFGVDLKDVKSRYKELGDQGNTAQHFCRKVKSSISVKEVYDKLFYIAELEGTGSQRKKLESLAELYSLLDKSSLRYVARIPVGKLRLGFSEKTLMDALSVFSEKDKSKSKEIKAAYNVVPDIALLAEKIKSHGIGKATAEIMPEYGIPVVPMLAGRLKSADQMIEKMGEVSVEPKFDGLRILIHYKKDKPVLAFSRNMKRIEESFPELEQISKYTDARELILDSEAIGVDPETAMFVDFQKTISRRRKHGIKQGRKDVPLTFQIFDVIKIDGKNFMNKTYLERRKSLESLFQPNDIFLVDEKTITKDADVIRDKHKLYRERGLEGVIVKKTSASYVAGRTGHRWVKMKEDEDKPSMLSDTIDAVVMGYTAGRGKRASFGIGQFLAGIRNGQNILTLTKVGTGMSDKQFVELREKLSKLTVEKKPEEYKVHQDLFPDFWVEPSLVVELAADEITVSPKHTAGYALRFPRLVKLRPDKDHRQATSLKELKNISGNFK